MKKRNLGILLLITLLLTSVWGCSQKSSTAEPDTSALPKATSQPEESKDTAVTSTDQKQPIEVVYYENFDPETHDDRIDYNDIEKEFGPVPIDQLPDGITLGALLPDLSNEFWLMAEQGEKAAAEEYGIQIDSQCAMNETDYDAQLAMGEAMIAQKYDAYILSPLTDDCLTSVSEAAQNMGAPVVNGLGQQVKNANTFVGSMNYSTGVAAAEYAKQKLPDGGKAAVVMGQVGVSVTTARTTGFKDTLEGSNIEVVAELPAEWNAETAMNLTTDMFATTPDVDVIFCNNDNMALGVVEALRTLNKVGDVIVIGVDGTSDGYTSIEKGELTATVDTFPYKCGYYSVEMAIRLLAGQDIPRVVATPMACVDKDNMAEYK